MRPLEPIHYLRWARSRAHPGEGEIPLVLSGMLPPGPEWVEPIAVRELLEFSVAYHPPLAEELSREWRLPPEQILVASGSHWNLLMLMAARLAERPGAVIVEDPAYEPLWRIPEFLGAEVVRLPRPRRRQHRPDFDRLQEFEALRPSLLVLTQPHNPSGMHLLEEDIEELRSFASRSGCAVISDEVYVEFFDEPARVSLLGTVPGATVVRSFTKVFGLGALRASAAAGDAEWIARAAAITDYGPVALPAPSHTLARRAWARREALWSRARRVAAEGRSAVESWSQELRDLLELTLPAAGIICFPRLGDEVHAAALRLARRRNVVESCGYGLDRWPDGSHVWIEDLRRRSGVLLTPGEFFGDPQAFRLGFGIESSRLAEALDRIGRYLRMATEEA
jgi:aspartate/methionine/tyrosine aminotransferase